jgi:hypothetical protein
MPEADSFVAFISRAREAVARTFERNAAPLSPAAHALAQFLL